MTDGTIIGLDIEFATLGHLTAFSFLFGVFLAVIFDGVADVVDSLLRIDEGLLQGGLLLFNAHHNRKVVFL